MCKCCYTFEEREPEHISYDLGIGEFAMEPVPGVFKDLVSPEDFNTVKNEIGLAGRAVSWHIALIIFLYILIITFPIALWNNIKTVEAMVSKADEMNEKILLNKGIRCKFFVGNRSPNFICFYLIKNDPESEKIQLITFNKEISEKV